MEKAKEANQKLILVNKKKEEMLQKMRKENSKEVGRLLDENKKLSDKNHDLEMSIKNRNETERENREERNKSKTIEAEKKEKEKRARTKCRYVDSPGGCQKSRCQFLHPTQHCKKFLTGAGCLQHMCKELHSEEERNRLRSVRNNKKRQREQSPEKKAARTRHDETKICREWERAGRCRSYSTGSMGCRDGSHPKSTKQGEHFLNRAPRRAVTRGQPEVRSRGSSR